MSRPPGALPAPYVTYSCPLPPLSPLRHEWPQWQPQDLHRIFPTLNDDGIDLLRRMLAYDPAMRISVSKGGREMFTVRGPVT